MSIDPKISPDTSPDVKAFSIALAGAGNMGGAMMRGWIGHGIAAKNIMVLDPSVSPAMRAFLDENNIALHADAGAMQPVDVLILALKPQIMDTVLPALKPLVGPASVVVSVAAGKTLSSISQPLGWVAAVRAMPNTPALVNRGITVACASDKVDQIQRRRVDQLLRATGKVVWVEDEALMDAVTAVSGSGPAYVFYLAECMAMAGKAAGLPDQLAMTLALETVSGAGELLRLSDEDPAVLRKNVTSSGGTTAAALEVLMDDKGMAELLERAIIAAQRRSRELS